MIAPLFQKSGSQLRDVARVDLPWVARVWASCRFYGTAGSADASTPWTTATSAALCCAAIAHRNVSACKVGRVFRR